MKDKLIKNLFKEWKNLNAFKNKHLFMWKWMSSKYIFMKYYQTFIIIINVNYHSREPTQTQQMHRRVSDANNSQAWTVLSWYYWLDYAVCCLPKKEIFK